MIKHVDPDLGPPADPAPAPAPAAIPTWGGIQEGDDIVDEPIGADPPPANPADPNPADPNPNPARSSFGDRTGDLLDDNTPPEGGEPADPNNPDANAEPDPNAPPVNPEVEVYTGIASILKDQGFFADVEGIEDIKDPTSLAAAFDKEVQARLSDRQKEILEYKNQGVPVDKVSKLQTALQETAAITPAILQENEELAKNLLISDLTYKGMDKTSAEVVYNSLKASNSLMPEAIKALEARKSNLSGLIREEVDGAKAAKDLEKKTQLEAAQALDKQLSSTEIFGRKLNARTVEKVKALASTPVGYTQGGEPMNAVMKYKIDNPVDFEHKLVYLFAATNGFKDLNTFDRSAESRISNSMRSSVRTMSAGSAVSNQKVPTNAGTVVNIDDIDDIV